MVSRLCLVATYARYRCSKAGSAPPGGGVRAISSSILDQFALPAALLHQCAGHEGRALGEEVQDVQAGRAQDPLVEQGRVEGEVPLGVAARGAQPQGERLVTEFHGLYVGHGEVAEGVQGVGEGVDDGLLLVGGQRAFPVRRARATSSVASVVSSFSRVRFSPLKETNPEIRSGFSTSPAPGPSATNSFLYERRDHARGQVRHLRLLVP